MRGGQSMVTVVCILTLYVCCLGKFLRTLQSFFSWMNYGGLVFKCLAVNICTYETTCFRNSCIFKLGFHRKQQKNVLSVSSLVYSRHRSARFPHIAQLGTKIISLQKRENNNTIQICVQYWNFNTTDIWIHCNSIRYVFVQVPGRHDSHLAQDPAGISETVWRVWG